MVSLADVMICITTGSVSCKFFISGRVGRRIQVSQDNSMIGGLIAPTTNQLGAIISNHGTWRQFPVPRSVPACLATQINQVGKLSILTATLIALIILNVPLCCRFKDSLLNEWIQDYFPIYYIITISSRKLVRVLDLYKWPVPSAAFTTPITSTVQRASDRDGGNNNIVQYSIVLAIDMPYHGGYSM